MTVAVCVQSVSVGATGAERVPKFPVVEVAGNLEAVTVAVFILTDAANDHLEAFAAQAFQLLAERSYDFVVAVVRVNLVVEAIGVIPCAPFLWIDDNAPTVARWTFFSQVRK